MIINMYIYLYMYKEFSSQKAMTLDKSSYSLCQPSGIKYRTDFMKNVK